MAATHLTVILSTYNQADWLHKVIAGYTAQSFRDFELIIADDGSGEETRKLIENMQHTSDLEIHHIWQEDAGFRKTQILNIAIKQARHDYLVFSDGDCIPRNDFLAQHVAFSENGYYLSGGYCKLPMNISKKIDTQDIVEQRAFDPVWLARNGARSVCFSLKLNVGGRFSKILNRLSRTKTTWNGHNSSGWRSDILEVNGFDERMGYGGEDWEMGLRLKNLGIKAKRIRYSAICVHLDHARSYETKESHKLNESIGCTTIASGSTWTKYGIKRSV
ncbi:MAG: glycosyltransferase family 2 protein [Gammaproteobacteria bacterium]